MKVAVRVVALLGMSGIVGCVVPIAIWPAPREGAGRQVEFVDATGDSLDVDGVMIVSWMEEYGGWHVNLENCSPSNHVVAVRSGRASLPVDLKLQVLVVYIPHPMAGMVIPWFAYSIVNAPHEIILALPLAPIVLVWPELAQDEMLFVLPLVPGYWPAEWVSDSQGVSPLTGTWDPQKWDGRIELRRHVDDPATARKYWERILAQLRIRKQPTRGVPDLRLPPRQYAQVKAFIEEEIRIIERIHDGEELERMEPVAASRITHESAVLSTSAPHPNPLPGGEGIRAVPHPDPLRRGKGICPHPGPLPGGEGMGVTRGGGRPRSLVARAASIAERCRARRHAISLER